MLNILTIHHQSKISQSSPDSLRIQGPPRPRSGLLLPVSTAQNEIEKGGKCKISQVLQSPVSSPQASPKVETSDRPKQAQHLSTCRKVKNGNFRVHQGLSDSRGMGVIDRPVCRHPHIPFHQSPRKYLTLSLGWIINQEKSELKPIQVFPFHGLRITPRFSPCKTHSEIWLNLQDPFLHLKSKHVLTSRCLMSLTGLLTSMEKIVPERRIHMKLLQFLFFSCKSICHSSEPQSSIVCISSPISTCLGHRCSEHNLVGSLCLCLSSHGSPS